MRLVAPLIKMVWETHRGLATTMVLLRLVAAFVPIATLAGDARSYQDLALTEGTVARYRLRARNPGGFSAYAATVSAQSMLASPGGSLRVTGVHRNKVNLA